MNVSKRLRERDRSHNEIRKSNEWRITWLTLSSFKRERISFLLHCISLQNVFFTILFQSSSLSESSFIKFYYFIHLVQTLLSFHFNIERILHSSHFAVELNLILISLLTQSAQRFLSSQILWILQKISKK